MNKNDLVTIATDKLSNGTTHAAVNRTLEAILSSIMEAVAIGDTVRIPGFGTFDTGERSARTGRNPQTGDPVEIPAATTIKFKPSTKFKEAVNS